MDDSNSQNTGLQDVSDMGTNDMHSKVGNGSELGERQNTSATDRNVEHDLEESRSRSQSDANQVQHGNQMGETVNQGAEHETEMADMDI